MLIFTATHSDTTVRTANPTSLYRLFVYLKVGEMIIWNNMHQNQNTVSSIDLADFAKSGPYDYYVFQHVPLRLLDFRKNYTLERG